MTPDQIKALVLSGESETLEFKTTTGTRREAAMTICAMLNQRGGHVLFGVMPEGAVVGQDVNERTIEKVSAEMQRIDPPTYPEIQRVRVSDSRQVIAVRVGPGSSPPYQYRGVSYRRVGNATRNMSADEYNRMLFERMHTERRWENQPAAGSTAMPSAFSQMLNAFSGTLCRLQAASSRAAYSASTNRYIRRWPLAKRLRTHCAIATTRWVAGPLASLFTTVASFRARPCSEGSPIAVGPAGKRATGAGGPSHPESQGSSRIHRTRPRRSLETLVDFAFGSFRLIPAYSAQFRLLRTNGLTRFQRASPLWLLRFLHGERTAPLGVNSKPDALCALKLDKRICPQHHSRRTWKPCRTRVFCPKRKERFGRGL